MNIVPQFIHTNFLPHQYRTLLAVAEAISAPHDFPSLLNELSRQLRLVTAFDACILLLHDEEQNMMRVHQVEDQVPRADTLLTELPVEESPGGRVWQTQQPMLVPNTAQESRFPRINTLLRENGMQSYCLLPLTSAGRRLGTLGFASLTAAAWNEADLEFLQQVTNQVAIAVDNVLNFERARKAEQAVKQQLERERLRLEINNAVVTNLNLSDLLAALSSGLHRVLPHDFAGMALYDPSCDQLRVQALDYKRNTEVLGAISLIPLKGTGAGKAFTSRKTLLLRRFDTTSSTPEIVRCFVAAGLKSSCHVPLIAGDRALGTLDVMSFREAAFTEEDAELLTQIGKQIAIAVENALNFERACKAEQEIRRKFERERLMLEINNAVVTQLSLQDIVHATATCLRDTLGHEIIGFSLYDSETHQLRTYAYKSPDQQFGIAKDMPVPLETSLGGMAFTSGQAVFFNHLTLKNSPEGFSRQFVEAGIQSGGCIPLIVQGRKLGVMGLWSFREDAFPEDQQELLGHIANQIAIAVDNALNFERARKAEREVQRKLEREHLMLEINNAIVSKLDLRELVRVISSCLREALQYQIVGLSLYDPDTDQLRAYAYDFPDKQFAIEEGTPIPMEGSLGGKAFSSGQAVFLNRTNPQGAVSDFNRQFIDVGVRSGGCVPLIVRGRKLGVLGVGSFRENAFPAEHQELLSQIVSQVAIAVDNALAYREIETLKNKLSEEKLYLEEEINTTYNFEEVIGSSPALRRILKKVETVAPTDSTVLIQGETGTGKELIARAIHNLSARRDRTLVKLNCAAIPSGLLESELFGHERGAFTGAIAQRIGRFELAHKGTLFLDEVGEIPLDLQPKLLRVLQEQEFERLGNTRTQKVDVRLIAATNRDLAAMAAENKFRSDLFYRLNVFPLTIPPLRERPDDVPALVRFFANKFAVRMKRQIKTIPAEAVAVLQQYHWPGNIRELENLIERAVILTQGAELQIPLAEINLSAKPAVVIPQLTAPSSSDIQSLEAFERDHILRILKETNWIIGGPHGAAARLQMKRTTLQARMKKLGIIRR